MKRNFAFGSLLLFGLSILFLLALTVFESALAGVGLGAERMISFLFLVLPAMIGVVLGVMSLVRREGQTGLAITAIILNTIFALFHLLIILFAG